MYHAQCRHCDRQIIQHSTGCWKDNDGPEGLYCQPEAAPGAATMEHEPMPKGLKGEPQWVT